MVCVVYTFYYFYVPLIYSFVTFSSAKAFANCREPNPTPDCSKASTEYRTHDGTCNNLKNPNWGAGNTPVRRILGKDCRSSLSRKDCHCEEHTCVTDPVDPHPTGKIGQTIAVG